MSFKFFSGATAMLGIDHVCEKAYLLGGAFFAISLVLFVIGEARGESPPKKASP